MSLIMSDGNEHTEKAEDDQEMPPGVEAEAAGDAMLSAEEQMAQFEDSLKEDDWGHQPC